MKRRTVQFDVRSAIAEAWDFLWKENLRERAENAKQKHVYREGRTYYLTASDLENQVRAWAEDELSGRPRSQKRAFGGYGFAVVRMRGDLQGAVRDFLLRGNGGRIVGHNFGRGHISGMRFRPRGEPISEAETETLAKKERQKGKPRPCHYSESTYGGALLCVSRKRNLFSRGRRTSRTTRDAEKVTCPRCLRLLGARQPTPARAVERLDDANKSRPTLRKGD